jgi:hypothetical protein
MDDASSFMESIHENETGNSHVNIEWSKEHEDILIEWADKAMCYRWLHARSNAKFAHLSRIFSIPVIIISTLTGTANFAQDRVPVEYLSTFVMAVGGLNILAGIISTIQQFLKINELNEAHRVSSIAWDKFYRNIKVELAKNRKERVPVSQMIKLCKEEFDRLMETSPVIREDIINKFTSTFKGKETFLNIQKPEICDDLVSTRDFLVKEKEKAKDTISKPFAEMLRRKKEQEKNKRLIQNFITQFKFNQDREPLEDEVVEHFSEIMPEAKVISLFKMVQKEARRAEEQISAAKQSITAEIGGRASGMAPRVRINTKVDENV